MLNNLLSFRSSIHLYRGEINWHSNRRTVLRGIGAGAVGLTGFGSLGTASAQDSISVTGVWTGGEQEDFLAVVDYVEGETDLEIEPVVRDGFPRVEIRTNTVHGNGCRALRNYVGFTQ